MRTELPKEFSSTAAGAVAERVLRSCVHCGMCNATCPTYQLTGDELDGPRGRIYLLKQALEGQPVTSITQTHLDRCLSCRACETTCPSGVEYHKLYDIGQAVIQQAQARSWRSRWLRKAIGSIAPFPGRLRAAIRPAYALRRLLPESLRSKVSRPSPPRTAIAQQHGRRMLLLSGCVQSVIADEFNAATVRVFDRLGISLIEAPATACCGALNFHLQQHDSARELARRNIDAWWPHIEQGAEAIIVNASGCAVFMLDYATLLADDAGYASKAEKIAQLIRDPVELLTSRSLRPTSLPATPRIAVHEPCTLQHGLRLTGAVTGLLQTLGYQPQPVRDAHLCCGSAGAYSLLEPQMARSLRLEKLRALTAGNPETIYTGNIGCWMHLREGTSLPVRHWIEAVDAVAPCRA